MRDPVVDKYCDEAAVAINWENMPSPKQTPPVYCEWTRKPARSFYRNRKEKLKIKNTIPAC